MLLARALEELDVPRDKVYITNAVKHFKFELRGKRRIHKTPAQQEAAACLHWLESEIELVDPEALVALGATAARQLMGTAVAVTRERGRWLERSDGRRVLITLHPSALLRMEPEDKAAAYAAWLADLKPRGEALRVVRQVMPPWSGRQRPCRCQTRDSSSTAVVRLSRGARPDGVATCRDRPTTLRRHR